MDGKRINYEPIFVSEEENEIINDIRSLEFGKILINIQNGVMVNKEITRTVRNIHKKNNIPNNNGNNNNPNNSSLDNYS